MIASKRALNSLGNRSSQAYTIIRNLYTNAPVLQEGLASSSSSLSSSSAIDALAALRRKVAEEKVRFRGHQEQQRRLQERRESQDGSDRPRRSHEPRVGMQRGRTDDRRDRRVEGRIGGSRQGQRRGEGSNRGARKGGRGGLPGRFRQDEFEIKLTPTPIQTIHPVTNWQHSMYRIAQGINRVPYKSPEVTIESVRKTEAFNSKTYKPLYQAEKALKLHFGKGGVKIGPLHSPTITARPRNRLDDAPLPVRNLKNGSVAAEAREARVKLLQEKSGGDYQRWDISRMAKSTEEEDVIPAELHAAEAVTHNDDLGPSNKLWAVETVRKILNKN